MAQRKVKVKECDRDLKSTPATQTIPFSYNGTSYEIDCCDDHARQFDRAMSAWIAVARELAQEGRVFDESENQQWRDLLKREAEHRQQVAPSEVATHLLRHGEDEDDPYVEEPPVFSEWTLTDHAIARQLQRGFTHDEVMLAATAPERAFLHHKPGQRKHIRGRVTAVVAVENKAVVTVMFAKREEYLAHLKENASAASA